jgi:hypothetical protein
MPLTKILLVFLLQIAPGKDIAELRKFLGRDFAGASSLLAPWNNFLLNNVQRNSPAQADRMRFEMSSPAALGPNQNVVPLTITNAGRGLVTLLFEDDFITEGVNLVFCPADPRSVVALQVLFDDRKALRDTPYLLRQIYGLPEPDLSPNYIPSMKYDLAGITYDDQNRWTKAAGAPNVMVFSLDNDVEVLYQPVLGQRLVTGQLWVGSKTAARTCSVPIVTKAVP